jgi:hypothetical protein
VIRSSHAAAPFTVKGVDPARQEATATEETPDAANTTATPNARATPRVIMLARRVLRLLDFMLDRPEPRSSNIDNPNREHQNTDDKHILLI